MAETPEIVSEQNGNGHKLEDENPSQNEQNDNLTKLEQDIIRQVEYYFSESNMRRDKFLTQKIEENEGKWIPFSVLLTFNRLKALSEDAKIVAETMLKSSHGIIEVSEDREKVRRHPDNPLPEFNEARRKELMGRTAYAKGFPLDSKMTTLIEYFNNNFEKVENVVMRKYFKQEDKAYYFKGSVFVLFETKEAAEDFVKREDLKYGEKTLLRYMQEEYFKVKRQELKDKSERKKAKAKQKEADEMKVELPKKAILHFATESDPTLRREDFKKRVLEIDPSVMIAFIHYDMGDKEGDIRFTKENDAVKFLEKVGESAKLTASGTEFTLSLVEGEQEEEFLRKAVEDMQRVINFFKFKII
jgi:lupus La protein